MFLFVGLDTHSFSPHALLGHLLEVSSAVVPGGPGQLSTEWYREYRYRREQKSKITEYRE